MQSASRLAGTTINLLIPAEGADKGVRDKLGEIKKRFGINVKVTALPVGPLIEKTTQSVKAKTGTYDAISVLGFTVSQFVGGGYFANLTPMVKKLPVGYGYPSDFAKGELDYLSYYDIKKQAFGGTTPYLIPGLYAGPILLFYRKDLLKDAGLSVPTNWTQYLAAAKKLNSNGIAGNTMIAKSGDVSMFLVDWFTRFVSIGGVLMSGSPQTKNFTPRLTSPQAVAALQHMVDCVAGLDPGRPLLRLHPLDRRLQRRQDGDDAHVGRRSQAPSTTRRRRRSRTRSPCRSAPASAPAAARSSAAAGAWESRRTRRTRTAPGR